MEYIQEPKLLCYTGSDLEVLKFETAAGVFYKLPTELPKSKRTLRHCLEEIIGECARDSNNRLLSADFKNIFPNYTLVISRDSSDESVIRVCEACLNVEKDSSLGKKIGPASRSAYNISLGGMIGSISYMLFKGGTAASLGTAFNAFYLGTTIAFLFSTCVKYKYGNFGWDPKYLKDRIFVCCEKVSDAGIKKLEDLANKYNKEKFTQFVRN